MKETLVSALECVFVYEHKKEWTNHGFKGDKGPEAHERAIQSHFVGVYVVCSWLKSCLGFIRLTPESRLALKVSGLHDSGNTDFSRRKILERR